MEFHASPAKIRGFVGGVGSGKSFVGAFDLFMRAEQKQSYGLISPTVDTLHETSLKSLRDLLDNFKVRYDWRSTRKILLLSNGARIVCRGADEPDNLRGPTWAGAWLDEGSVMKKEVKDIVLARLREGGQFGWMSVTFTPKGLEHWTYEMFGPRRAAGVELFHARTVDNPFLSEEYYATLATQYAPLRAQQELGGEFLNVEGSEWPPDYFDWPGFWFTDWPAGLSLKVMALDPSKGKGEDAPRPGDDSAFALLARDHRGHLYVDADLDNIRDVTKIVEDGLALYAAFQPDWWIIETNQFQSLIKTEIDRLSRSRGIAARTVALVNAGVSKQVRIRRLTPYLSQRIMHFRRTPSTERLVNQLRGFPNAEHDDGPDALEMAVRGAIELWNGRLAGKVPMRYRQ